MIAKEKQKRLRDAFGDYTAKREAVYIDSCFAARIVMAELQGSRSPERVAERAYL